MKIEHKTTAAFAVAVVMVGLVGAYACLNARQLLTASSLVGHSHDTLAKLGDLLRSIQGANTGAQEFFLTGQEAYLVPYEAGLEEIGQGIEDLRRQTSDNPAQGRNIDLLQHETNRQIAYLHQRVEARRAGGLEKVLPMLGLQGKEILDQIRFRAASIRSAELQLLRHREDAVQQAGKQAFAAFFALLGLTVVLLASGYAFIRKNLRRRLRADAGWLASERKFRGVLDTTHDAVFIVDDEGDIELANAQAQDLFGYTAGELAGNAFVSLLQSVPGPGGDRLMGKRKDQTLFPVHPAENAVEIGDERLVVHALENRTELERAQEALSQSSQELKRSDIELDRLAYVAGHDLQEPLSDIRNCTALLASESYRDKLDARAADSVACAVAGVVSLQKLLDDLQTLSRVDAHAKPHEAVDSQSVLDRVIADMKPVLSEMRAAIEVPIPLPEVYGDRKQIGQLFANLLDNALKFRGKEPPRLEITAALQSEVTWRFSVKDNGLGIDPQYFERIFVIFQRLHNEDQYPGTGIGLAVCQKIVERHGGRLWVESEPGAGADFLFTLPSSRRQSS